MAIAHPSRYFIHYLLSQSLGTKSKDAAVAAVVSRLGELGLPVPQDQLQLQNFLAALGAVRDKMKPPPGFNPAAANPSAATRIFLQTWKIEEAWRGGLRDVLQIFDDKAEMRRAISVLLLGPLSRKVVAHLVRKHFGLREHQLTTQTLLLYEHYFWNTNILDIQDWRRIFSKAWHPGYVTDFLLALDAPRDQVGAATVVNTALRQSSAVDAVHAFTTMQHYGFRMFMETAAGSGPPLPRAQAAALAFNVYRLAEEELDRRRGGSSEVMAELRKIGTLYDNRPIRTVIDIPIEPKTSGPGGAAEQQPEETPR